MSIIEKAVERAGIGTADPLPSDRVNGAAANRQRVVRRTSMERVAHARGFSDDVREVQVSSERLSESRIHYGKGDRVEQEFKRIKRPLVSNIATRSKSESGLGANFIAVTSAHPGEGKTYTSINLALALSTERDYEVLLIDGDTIRGGASKAFGLEEETGLIEYVRNNAGERAPNVVKIKGYNLYFLASGKGHYLSDDELSSKMARNLISSVLKPSNRIVIIDCPPLLSAAEATSIIDLSGQVLLVTEATKTAQADVDSAIAYIDKRKPVGLVLNKARTAGRTHYGNYYDAKK